jgi:hypothetical protein
LEPSAIPSLKLWLKADAVTTAGDGEQVATWTDASGAANHAVQTSKDSQPRFRTNVLGGKPALYFDDANDFMQTPLTLQSNYSVFVVFNRAFYPCGDKRVLFGDTGWFMGQYNCKAAHHIAGKWVAPLTTAMSQHQTAIFAGTQMAGNAEFYLDGARLTDTANPTTGNVGRLSLGANGYPFGGYVMEVIAFDTRLSTTQRNQITNYLKAKYDL